MLRVVKVGGSALEDSGWLDRFAAHAARSGPMVVVHGGGPEITALSTRLGVGVQWVNGRRVTTPEALDVAAMVLSGRINKRLVSALIAAGVDAFGLSGEDGALLVAEPAAGGDLGRVGVVSGVRAALLHTLLGAGLTPVVSPISRGVDGAPLNVNADEAATAIAAALGADELLYLTDVEGVRGPEGRLARLSTLEASALIATGTAREGMAVKLEAALAGVAAGIGAVRIGPLDMLVDAGAGTSVHAVEVAA